MGGKKKGGGAVNSGEAPQKQVADAVSGELRKENDQKDKGCPVILLESGCLLGKSVDGVEACDLVRFTCTNANCPIGRLVHADCYAALETVLVKQIATMSWARSWTDAQRRANMWDKKGYQLLRKVCQCRCGNGFIRRDLDYNLDLEPTAAADAGRAACRTKAQKQTSTTISNNSTQDSAACTTRVSMPTTGDGAASDNATAHTNRSNQRTNRTSYSTRSQRGSSLSTTQRQHNNNNQTSSSGRPLRDRNGRHESLNRHSRATGRASGATPLARRGSTHNNNKGTLNTVAEFLDACVHVLSVRAAQSQPSIKVKDKRIQDLKGRCSPALQQKIDAGGGITQTIHHAARKGMFTMSRDNEHDFVIHLPKMNSMGSYPTSDVLTRSRRQSPNNQSDDGECLGERSTPPPPISSVDPENTTHLGVIDNVFDNFGYIECKNKSTNVFFVPSHVYWPAVHHRDSGSRRNLEYPSLKDVYKPGDLVEFTCEAQEERCGCKWMAVLVSPRMARPKSVTPKPVLPESVVTGTTTVVSTAAANQHVALDNDTVAHTNNNNDNCAKTEPPERRRSNSAKTYYSVVAASGLSAVVDSPLTDTTLFSSNTTRVLCEPGAIGSALMGAQPLTPPCTPSPDTLCAALLRHQQYDYKYSHNHNTNTHTGNEYGVCVPGVNNARGSSSTSSDSNTHMAVSDTAVFADTHTQCTATTAPATPCAPDTEHQSLYSLFAGNNMYLGEWITSGRYWTAHPTHRSQPQ